MTAMSDASGTTSFSYDAANQLLAEDGPWADDTVTRSYTNRLRATLRLQSPNSSDWVQGYGYDSGKRLTSLPGPAGGFSFDYFGASPVKVASQTMPSTAVVYNSYDTVGRLFESYLFSDSLTALLDGQSYTIDVAGQRTQHAWEWYPPAGHGPSHSTDYTYDGAGQLKTAQGSRLFDKFGYAYDAAGNLAWRTNNGFLQAFNVNNLNELTTSTNKGKFTVAGTTSALATNVTVNTLPADLYEDATFASTNHTLANGANTFTAVARDSLGRLATNTVSCYLPATNVFTYDLNGNMLSDGTRFFEYDDENELISVTVSNSYRSEFTYDGKLRRRIRKEYSCVSGAWNLQSETRYVYDGNLVIHERDGNNSPLLSYTRGNDFSGSLGRAGGIGGLLARTDHKLLLAGDVNAHAYYHCDGNGNITCLLNSNQIPVARYEYDPYGNILSQSGPLADANVYRFSSKEFHVASGLVYFAFRFYAPELERWLNQDPLGEFGGINLFAYCGNEPVSDLDAWGWSAHNAPPATINVLAPGTGNNISPSNPQQRQLTQFQINRGIQVAMGGALYRMSAVRALEDNDLSSWEEMNASRGVTGESGSWSGRCVAVDMWETGKEASDLKYAQWLATGLAVIGDVYNHLVNHRTEVTWRIVRELYEAKRQLALWDWLDNQTPKDAPAPQCTQANRFRQVMVP
jgi:RHS repeat-associated protein